MPLSTRRAGSCRSSTQKKLLKAAFAKRLPAYLLDQPKRGFFTPAAKWLVRGFLKMAREVLSTRFHPATRDLFDWDGIRTMLKVMSTKSRYTSHSSGTNLHSRFGPRGST